MKLVNISKAGLVRQNLNGSWKGFKSVIFVLSASWIFLASQSSMAQLASNGKTMPQESQVLEEQFRKCPKGYYSGYRSGRSTYQHDPFLWVVSPQFAKDFCFPDASIDSQLEGAEAIAYRVVAGGEKRCNRSTGQEKCFDFPQMQFSIYLRSELLPRKNPNQKYYQRIEEDIGWLIQSNEPFGGRIEKARKNQEDWQPKYPFQSEGMTISVFQSRKLSRIYKRVSVTKLMPSIYDGLDLLILTADGGSQDDYDEKQWSKFDWRITLPPAAGEMQRFDVEPEKFGHTIKLPLKFILKVLEQDQSYDTLPFSKKSRQPYSDNSK
jgi:hypothetical protein